MRVTAMIDDNIRLMNIWQVYAIFCCWYHHRKDKRVLCENHSNCYILFSAFSLSLCLSVFMYLHGWRINTNFTNNFRKLLPCDLIQINMYCTQSRDQLLSDANAFIYCAYSAILHYFKTSLAFLTVPINIYTMLPFLVK